MMKHGWWASSMTAVSVLGVVVAVAGCAQDSAAAPAPVANPAVVAPPATVASLIDPRWMGLGTSDLWNWEIVERLITSDFQQFGLRPLNSDEGPRRGGCGCGSNPLEASTAVLTAFAVGQVRPDRSSRGPAGERARSGRLLPPICRPRRRGCSPGRTRTTPGRPCTAGPPTPASLASWSHSQATFGPPTAPRSGCR